MSAKLAFARGGETPFASSLCCADHCWPANYSLTCAQGAGDEYAALLHFCTRFPCCVFFIFVFRICDKSSTQNKCNPACRTTEQIFVSDPCTVHHPFRGLSAGHPQTNWSQLWSLVCITERDHLDDDDHVIWGGQTQNVGKTIKKVMRTNSRTWGPRSPPKFRL